MTEGGKYLPKCPTRERKENSKHAHTYMLVFIFEDLCGLHHSDAARVFLPHRCSILSKVVRRPWNTAQQH